MVGLVYHLVYAGVLMSGMETIVRIVRTCCTLICHSFSEVSVHVIIFFTCEMELSAHITVKLPAPVFDHVQQ